MNEAAVPRCIPVYVLLPPRTLLLDVAGPLEALRRANVVQDSVRFDVGYFGPARTVLSSIGLSVSGIAPLPPRLPDDAMVVVAGNVTDVLPQRIGPNAIAIDEHAAAQVEDAIEVDLHHQETHRRLAARNAATGSQARDDLLGALFAGRAGLFDGRDCTTHYFCCGISPRPLPRLM